MNGDCERKTLSMQYGRPVAWREEQEPIVTFWLDGGVECVGFPFFAMAAARYLGEEQTATFEWPFGTIVVRGPKTLEFYDAFCSYRVTGAKAAGRTLYP